MITTREKARARWLPDAPRLAVIGCGAVAGERHLPALSEMGWRPRVLVDPRLERAAELARRHDVERVVRDVSELAAGEVGAALVATNSALHARVALPLLENGVHVFVEKPLATSTADARAMTAAAAANSPPVVLAVGNMRRFLFVNRWVKMLIERGALGEVESFDVREGECFHRRPSRNHPRRAAGTGQFSPAFWNRETAGGGVLLDTGSHTLDTLTWWLGGGDGDRLPRRFAGRRRIRRDRRTGARGGGGDGRAEPHPHSAQHRRRHRQPGPGRSGAARQRGRRRFARRTRRMGARRPQRRGDARRRSVGRHVRTGAARLAGRHPFGRGAVRRRRFRGAGDRRHRPVPSHAPAVALALGRDASRRRRGAGCGAGPCSSPGRAASSEGG